MAQTLVTYFSASGVTRRVAERLAREKHADLYEITPAVPYTRADLNWNLKTSRSSVEMNDSESRPELGGDTLDISGYDDIWVGFPIWWYTAPHIILTFLESYDFSGKTIHPFATSGGSGFGKTADVLKASAPGANVLDGVMK